MGARGTSWPLTRAAEPLPNTAERWPREDHLERVAEHLRVALGVPAHRPHERDRPGGLFGGVPPRRAHGGGPVNARVPCPAAADPAPARGPAGLHRSSGRWQPRPTSSASARATARQHLSGLYRRTGCLNAAQAAYWLGMSQLDPRPDGHGAAPPSSWRWLGAGCSLAGGGSCRRVRSPATRPAWRGQGLPTGSGDRAPRGGHRELLLHAE